jgi:transcriptional regulator with XRE-family HTH domain
MTEHLRKQIASRLRLAREAAGLSQGQVAKMLNVHRPTISEIEAGRRRVSADELSQFAKIYGVSVSWLTAEQITKPEPAEDRIMLAARQLSKMKDEDLDRLMNLLRMLRKPEDDA